MLDTAAWSLTIPAANLTVNMFVSDFNSLPQTLAANKYFSQMKISSELK